MKQGFYREYGLRILFVVVFLLALIWLGTRRTFESNSNSVEDWLPDQYQETSDYRWFQKYFPFESFIVASWEGCTLDDDRIELFAQKLVPSQTIDNFSLAAPGEEITADLRLTPSEDEPTAVSALTAASPWADVSAQGTAEAGEESIESNFRSVMTGPRLVRLLEQTYARSPQNRSPEEIRDEILTRLSGTLIGPDKQSTAMIITLNNGFKGGGKKIQKLIDQVKKISVECGLPDTTVVKSGSVAARMVNNVKDVVHELIHGRSPQTNGLIMGGPPTDNAAIDSEGTRTLFRLAFICAIVSVSIALVCLHDFWLTMFVFWVAILAAGVSLALVSFTGGKCDSILLSMPALVYVLAMSGAIHLVNYYYDAIREGGLEGACERAVSHAFSPCFFAQLTTAIGMVSLLFGGLTPITNFGFYSAIGVLMSLLLLFFYLPALLFFFPAKKFAAKHGGKGMKDNDGFIGAFWGAVGGFIVRHHNFVALCCLGMMCFFGYYLPKIKTSVKMMNFFSPDAEIIAHYTWLEEKLGPLVPMEMVISFDNARLPQNLYGTTERLQLINRISSELKSRLGDNVGGTLSVAMFIPDLNANWKPGTIAYRTAAAAIGKNINDSRDVLSDYLTIEGNPTLDQIAELLESAIRTQTDAVAKKRQELADELAADGKDPSILGDDRLQLDDSALETITQDTGDDTRVGLAVDDSGYKAAIQDLKESEDHVLDLRRMLMVLRNEKTALNSNEITDLESMTARLERGRPFHTLSAADATRLLDACRYWQEQKGIELWRISIRVWSLKRDIDYSVFINDVRGVVEPILDQASKEILEASGAPAADPSTLAADFGPAHQFDTIHPAGISAKYTGTVPLVYKTQHELIRGLAKSIVSATFLIAFVVVFVLWNVPGGLIAMLPNLFPVVVVFGFMSWMGILVDVGTMMTASVALGVAVDDTMHYLTWFSDGIARGMTPQQSAVWGYKRCATAMTQSTLIAGLGLSAFMFSTFIPTQRFGVLMLVILFAALFGDLIFLPSLLTGPAGRFFLKPRKRWSLLMFKGGTAAGSTSAPAETTDAESAQSEPEADETEEETSSPTPSD